MVKDVRRCSAGRARRIRGFNPHRSRNIYMYYVSTVVEKDKCCCYRCEKYHNSAQKNSILVSLIIYIGIMKQNVTYVTLWGAYLFSKGHICDAKIAYLDDIANLKSYPYGLQFSEVMSVIY